MKSLSDHIESDGIIERYEDFISRSTTVLIGNGDISCGVLCYEKVYMISIDGVIRYFKYYSMSPTGENDIAHEDFVVPELHELIEVYPQK